MTVSTRTPEGDPHRCAICGGVVVTERSEPLGDSVCPSCGALIRQIHDKLAASMGIPRDRLTLDTNFTRELGFDSLDTVEMVMQIEEDFDINIPDEEAEKIQNVADAIRAILRRRNQFPGDWKRENR